MTSPVWTIEDYCRGQQENLQGASALAASSQALLQSLALPSEHPFCTSFGTSEEYDVPGVPRQGPLLQHDHLETWYDVVVTVIAMGVPSIAAMAELWLRLFAAIIAPLGICHLLRHELAATKKSKSSNFDLVVCFLTVASSIVLLTDTLYVLEFGPQYGFTLFCLAVVLTWRRTPNRRMRSSIVLTVILVAILIVDTSSWSLVFGEPADHVEISEGLYYHSENTRAQAIAQSWPQEAWDYAKQDATPWMPTGDARTGLPFILNKDRVPNPDWTRVWMPTSDGEVVALDWSFPTTGHDTAQPVYFVLHGLNGGSNEEYVKDFTHRRNAERSTVVVMIARGLQDLPVRGWDIFHGARWTDAHQASQKIKEVLVPGQMLAGVGFSMGAIIMGNLVTRTGNECALDAAVAISGGLDMRFETHFHRAQRLWQPILTTELRDTFVVGKWGERVRHRLSKDQLKQLMRATHISEVDRTAVVAYNGFDDLNHYYSEMSALGDIPPEEYYSDRIDDTRRIHNVSIPLCVLHAFDDPLVTWRTVAANRGWMHPVNLTRTGSGNLFLLLTKQGGHVGWPLGWAPFVDKWKYMNDAASSFVKAVAASQTA